MLRGERINLSPVREADLSAFYAAHMDVSNRGPYFPLGVMSEPKLRQGYAETGFWQREEGTLLIVTPQEIWPVTSNSSSRSTTGTPSS